MTHPAFLALLPAERVRVTLVQGTFLVRRRRRSHDFQLYHLPNAGLGIFVELDYEPLLRAIVIVRSFVDSARLSEYLLPIRLPSNLLR